MAQGRVGRLAAALRDERGRIIKPSGGSPDPVGTEPNNGGTDNPPDSGSHGDGTSLDAGGGGAVDPGTGFRAPEPVRRGRGRPRKERGGDTAPGAPARATKTKKSVVEVSQGTLANHILELHEFLATMTEIKRFELEQRQANALAKAIHGANEHVKIPILTGKYMALAVLAWTAGRIYLPMAKDIIAERAQPPRPSPGVAASPPPPVNQTAPAVAGDIVPVVNDADLAGEWLGKTTH